MAMARRNIALAKEVLFGETLGDAAKNYGLSKGRAWQITRAFCLEYMLDHEKLDDYGKLKNLKELRRAWRSFFTEYQYHKRKGNG